MVHLGLKWKDLFGEEEDEMSPEPDQADRQEDELASRSARFRAFLDALPPVTETTGGEVLRERGLSVEMANWYGYRVHERGIALPSRSEDGLTILGIQLRTGLPGHKYEWLKVEGVSPPYSALYHVCQRSVGFLQQGFRLTEGVIKADVSATLTPVPTVGIMGVSSWVNILPLVRKVRPVWVSLAFDQDWKTNGGVRRARRDLARALNSERIDVFTESWPEEYNGIDDFLASGRPVCEIERNSWSEGF